MRRRRTDPLVAADLEALDAALAGERGDPEVTLIADAARGAAEPMSPAFAARLDAAAAEGFPAPARARARARVLRGRAPALGTLAAGLAAVAVAVVISSGGGGSPSSSSSLSSPAQSSAPQHGGASAGVAAPASATATAPLTPRAAAGAAVANDTATVVPPPGAGPRRIEQASELTIATPIGRLQDTADAVTSETDHLGGYVASSQVSAQDEQGTAVFALRIPAARLAEAIAALSRLGHVRARSDSTRDITSSFSSALAALRDAQATRDALLRALATAPTAQAIASLQAQLRVARGRIAAGEHRLQGVRRASDLASVSVTVVGVSAGAGAGVPPSRPWTPGRALHDAGRVLTTAASLAIVTLAGALPVGLLALLAALAWRGYRRRQRELALQPGTPAV